MNWAAKPLLSSCSYVQTLHGILLQIRAFGRCNGNTGGTKYRPYRKRPGKSSYIDTIWLWGNQENWWLIFLENKSYPIFLNSVMFKWYYFMDVNLPMFISVDVYNCDTDIWYQNSVRFVDHSSFNFFDLKVAPFCDLTVDKILWSILLQKNWIPIFLKLLIVI